MCGGGLAHQNHAIWRDLGYVAGAGIAVLFAGALGLAAAIWAAAALSLASAAVVLLRMRETHPR